MGKLQPKTILNRRIKELKRIFSEVDSEKMKVIEPSLIQAAKMEMYIVDLADRLDQVGFVETYKNGENQTGKKESTESRAYSTMIKNYNAVIRTLLTCLPESEQKDAEDEMLAFLKKRGRP